MNDYRGRICLIKDKLVLKCIAQDFYSGKLYFELPSHLTHLDCGYCTVPSFEVYESDVEIYKPEASLDYIIEHYNN